MTEKESDNWSTPQWLFEQLDQAYGPFKMDVCASAENSKCGPNFLTDCLNEKSWFIHAINGKNWMNPPFSDPGPFIQKAIFEAQFGAVTGALLPYDHSVKWWKLIEGNSQAKIVERFPFRIKFDPPPGWTKKIHQSSGPHVFVLFTPKIVRGQTEIPERKP